MSESRKNILKNTRVLVCLAVLIALEIIMTRLFKIDLGFARFNLGSVAAIMAGLWFGPLCGALTGGIADILGSFLQGYAPNPLITAAAVLWGVIPALMLPLARKITGKMRTVMLCVSVFITSAVCTLILTTAGLVLFLGYHFYSIFPVRMAQFAVMTPVYCILVCCLFYSPITSYVNQNILR